MTMSANVLYSVLSVKENAHDENPIYCCDWVKSNTTGDSANASKDLIVTGALDGLVKVWVYHYNKLELLHTLEGHAMSVVSVAISPSALTIVSVSLDSNLILWNLSSGKKITEVATGESDVWKVVYSPDGEHIATGGHTGKLLVYGVNDGEINGELDTRQKFILSLDWSPDGKYIAAGLEDGTVCVLNVQRGKVLHTLRAHSLPVRSVAFSPCSKRLASASNDGFVKIYGVVTAGHQCTMKFAETWVVSVCFTPDGTRIAAGGADGRVQVASRDLSQLHVFDEHTDTVWGVHFIGNNKLLSVSKDGTIILYDCPPIQS